MWCSPERTSAHTRDRGTDNAIDRGSRTAAGGRETSTAPVRQMHAIAQDRVRAGHALCGTAPAHRQR